MQGLARKLNAAKPSMVGKMEWVMHARVPIIKLEHTSGMSGPAPMRYGPPEVPFCKKQKQKKFWHNVVW